MARTITELGPREVEFLATLSQKGSRLFKSSEAEEYWGSSEYTDNVLSRLVAKGWLERLEQGLYMVIPLEAGPTDRAWTEDALAVGTFIAPDGAASYWSAIRHWGWTTQLPQVVTFQTTRKRFNPRPIILGISYRFIRVNSSRLFGVTETWQGQLKLRVTDQERTMLDAMDRPDLSGGIAEVAAATTAAWHELDLGRLTEYIRQFGGGTVPKRLGYLAESLGLEPSRSRHLRSWQSMVGAGISLLERGGPATGPITRRWHLRINAGGQTSTRDGRA